MLFQYFINYNLNKGWYITWQPTLTANWQATNGGRWVVPSELAEAEARGKEETRSAAAVVTFAAVVTGWLLAAATASTLMAAYIITDDRSLSDSGPDQRFCNCA
jgi:hypothetical protein